MHAAIGCDISSDRVIYRAAIGFVEGRLCTRFRVLGVI